MASLDFKDLVVLVTGAGSGIGRGYAHFFGERGAKVVVNDVSAGAAQKVVDEIKKAGGQAAPAVGSVTEGKPIVDQAVKAFGTVHVLINNAGILRDKSFKKMEDSQWDAVIAVHLKGAYSMTKAVWPLFRQQKFGRVINTSSPAGIYGNMGQTNYSAAKMALVAFSKSLSIEGTKYDIRANTIVPLAASAMTETIMPPEVLKGLNPDFIAPIIGALTARNGPDVRGRIFEVGGGFYSELRWERSHGHLFKTDDTFTPTAIRNEWKDITDFSKDTEYPGDLKDAGRGLMKVIEAQPSLKPNAQGPPPPVDYKGQTVIITGAGAGLGRSYAHLYAKLGANVVVNDVSAKNAESVVKECEALGAKAAAAICSAEEGQQIVKVALDNFGGVHVLINNAGVLRDKAFVNMTEEMWDTVMAVHLRGTYRCCKAVWPIFQEQKYGRILVTSSPNGIIGAHGQGNYASAKAGLIGLGRSLAIEGKKNNILTNILAPSAGTAMTATVWTDEMVKTFSPDFVAPVVAFLTSKDNKATAQVVETYGGKVSVLRWQRTGGAVFQNNRVPTPEQVVAKWDEITNFDSRATHPANTQESGIPIFENFSNLAPEEEADYVDPEDNEKIAAAKRAKGKGIEYTYTERDVMLYNLGIGAHATELQWTYENDQDFQALPTFGVVPQFTAGLGDYDFLPQYNPGKLLHGEQFLSIKGKIPTSGSLINTPRLFEVLDKGKAAAVTTVIESRDSKTNELIFENHSTVFIRDSGNFGGKRTAKDRGPATAANTAPKRKPDAVVEEKTSADQAALYRLSGDYNPLHIDPQFSIIGGFKKPILHGLCSMGFAGRHVLKTFGPYKDIKVRFAGTVIPGETLITEMWKEGDKVIFQTKVKERDAPALSNAAVTLINAGAPKSKMGLPLPLRPRHRAQLLPSNRQLKPLTPRTGRTTDAHVPEGWDENTAGKVERVHTSVFISQVLPIRLASWDPRPFVASWYEETLLRDLVEITNDLKGRHAFRVESWEVARKDGGVFCHFSYVPPALDQLPRKAFTNDFHTPEDAVPDPTSPAALFLPLFIEAAHKHGGWPSWLGPWWSSLFDGIRTGKKASACSTEAGHHMFSGDLAPPKGVDASIPELRGWQRTAGAGRIWLVRGRQWTEDMNRFPSSRLRVEFDGPDVSQEMLYTLFRPYGRIYDIQPPAPVAAGALRFAMVTFPRISTAVNASNCLHGFSTPTKTVDYDQMRLNDAANVALSRLRIYFERPLKAHYFRDWVSNHPRIALPLLAFLVGAFSYTFFDPIREFFIKARIEGMWNLEKYPTVQFLHDNIYLPVKNTIWSKKSSSWRRNVDDLGRASFRDRLEAERNVERWLSEFPSTFIVVTGPPGSGKHDLVDRILKDEKKPSLLIDCAEIGKAKTDTAIVDGLASQTGYWPVFSFLQSLNGMIDLASVGLIGQKSGFSTPADQQMRNILDSVGNALKDVSTHARDKRVSDQKHKKDEINLAADRERQVRLIRQGVWHDGRLDCVAGNGIMSELGLGIEAPSEGDMETAAPLMSSTAPIDGEAVPPTSASITFEAEVKAATAPSTLKAEAEVIDSEAEMIKTLPIVVLRNFALKPARADLWNVLGEWGASLVENKVAHVIVVGEGSIAAKTLTAALPSKPLNIVNLSDADDYNALEFVREKLSSEGHAVTLSSSETTDVAKLGGRMVDLELLVYKVRSGQSISSAVDDIVFRNAVEIRKTAFGDDTEEAKHLPWTRAQAWKIVSALSRSNQLSYAQLLSEFPFKGYDTCLKAMEEHGLIFITTTSGGRTCPATVKPGKPVFRESFKSLVDEPIFHAMSQIEYNTAVTKKAEADIADLETELAKLKSITSDGDRLGVASASWFGKGSPIHQRAQYLADELGKRMDKIRKAEADSAEQLKAFAIDARRK